MHLNNIDATVFRTATFFTWHHQKRNAWFPYEIFWNRKAILIILTIAQRNQITLVLLLQRNVTYCCYYNHHGHQSWKTILWICGLNIRNFGALADRNYVISGESIFVVLQEYIIPRIVFKIDRSELIFLARLMHNYFLIQLNGRSFLNSVLTLKSTFQKGPWV